MKKFSSFILALSMLLSVVNVSAAAETSLTKLDIAEIQGMTQAWKQEIPTTLEVGTEVSTALGFETVNSTDPAKFVIADDDKDEGLQTSNKVMKTVPTSSYARATDEQFGRITASNLTVTFDSKIYKIAEYDKNSAYYIGLIYTNNNLTKSNMIWVKKTAYTDSTTTFSNGWTGDGVNCGVFFKNDSNGNATDIAGTVGSSATFTLPSNDGAKIYAYQFKFSYPDNGNNYSQESITFDFDATEFMVSRAGISASWYTPDIYTTETNTQKHTSRAKLPKKDGVADYVTTDSDLDYITAVNDKEWHTVMIYADESNEDQKWYTIYYDGLPVYFGIDGGGYGCKIAKHSGNVAVGSGTKPALTAPVIVAGRGVVYNDHAPMYDDFYLYTKAATDSEIAKAVIDDIKAPYVLKDDVIAADIVLDPFESFADKGVTWSF